MNKEILSIIKSLKDSLEGGPWFGRPVYAHLEEVHPADSSKNPNENSHSLIELLFHMLTWAEFTLHRIQKDKEPDMKAFELLDWRFIDPSKDTWQSGVTKFKMINEKIIGELQSKEDNFLEEKVDYREYNFRFLIHGYMQHNIYHIGQIAYLVKLLT